MSNLITTNTTAVSFPEAGINKSEVLQEFADNVVSDIQKLGKSTNLNILETEHLNVNFINEFAHVRTSIRSLESNQVNLQRNSDTNIQTVDFHSKKDFSYAEGTPEANKLVIDQRYGQAYLPATEYTPVFYREDKNSGDIYEMHGLNVNVTPIYEPVIPGYVHTVESGIPKRAFNGQNSESWVRKLSYPLESEITEVICEVEVTLPNTTDSAVFNTVKINPFPVDRCDILGLWYKETASSSWKVLEEYPTSIKPGESTLTADEVKNSDMMQFIGQPRQVYAAKVRIRQRNWSEQNNKKTFIYGLQELDFKNVEYSVLNSSYSQSNLALNNHAIVKISAPEGRVFESLLGLTSDPAYNLEGSTTDNNHMLLYISKSPSLTSMDILWKSNSSPSLNTQVVALGLSEYYLIIQMKYVSQIKTVNSPFKNSTSPVLESLVITHKITAEGAGGAESNVDTTDWDGRNWALHKQFVSHMDIYRAAVEDGSNIFIFGDDFWTGMSHRSSLDDVIINNKLMSLTTTSDTPGAFGTVTYQTVLNTVWNSSGNVFVPKRVRIQSVAQIPGSGARLDFNLAYTTSSGSFTESFRVLENGLVSWTVGQTARVSSNWYTLNPVNGDMLDFTLSIKLTNSNTGTGKPVLGQFILILKD